MYTVTYSVIFLCFLFLGSHSPQPMNQTHHMGPILETALQRAPLLHILAGRLPAAVSRYR